MLFVGTSIIHPSTEGVFLLCNILDLLIYSKKEWINKVLIELKAIVEEYENDISLRHIGFPEDWYEQLEK